MNIYFLDYKESIHKPLQKENFLFYKMVLGIQNRWNCQSTCVYYYPPKIMKDFTAKSFSTNTYFVLKLLCIQPNKNIMSYFRPPICTQTAKYCNLQHIFFYWQILRHTVGVFTFSHCAFMLCFQQSTNIIKHIVENYPWGVPNNQAIKICSNFCRWNKWNSLVGIGNFSNNLAAKLVTTDCANVLGDCIEIMLPEYWCGTGQKYLGLLLSDCIYSRQVFFLLNGEYCVQAWIPKCSTIFLNPRYSRHVS